LKEGALGRTREIAENFYDAFNGGNIDAAASLFADDCESIGPMQGRITGKQAFRDHLVVFKRAMPDATVDAQSWIENEDTVAIEGYFSGTHTGPFSSPGGDVPATNRSVHIRFSDFMSTRNGLVVSHRAYFDQLELLTQLGFMPGQDA
jgi:steroid delta-isomerase-like uncharacterized protein